MTQFEAPVQYFRWHDQCGIYSLLQKFPGMMFQNLEQTPSCQRFSAPPFTARAARFPLALGRAAVRSAGETFPPVLLGLALSTAATLWLPLETACAPFLAPRRCLISCSRSQLNG